VPVLPLLRDTVPVLALVVLLVTAYRHLPAWVEGLVGAAAAGAALATGLLDRAGLAAEVRHLAPVVVFLAAILVVSECCRAEGLFDAIGRRVAVAGRAGALLGATLAVGAVLTVALSLDATAVLLTPVVVVAAASSGADSRPAQLACLRMANSASLLLPVSNLTNLLALGSLQLSFARFAVLMAPAWLVVVAVEAATLRWWFRAELRPGDPAGAVERGSLPPLPLAVIGLMLVAFAVTSPLGIDPAGPAVVAAAVLATRALRTRRLTSRELVRSAHVGFGVFVLGLGVVVAVLAQTPAGEAVGRLVPQGTGPLSLLLVAALGAVLANLANNLPATLVLVPLVAPLGAVALLAALIGINVGSSLTWTGSLANLLWRRALARSGIRASSRDFYAVTAVASPVAIVLGVLVLDGWSRLLG
jgi:arsenical pump membrane protein